MTLFQDRLRVGIGVFWIFLHRSKTYDATVECIFTMTFMTVTKRTGEFKRVGDGAQRFKSHFLKTG